MGNNGKTHKSDFAIFVCGLSYTLPPIKWEGTELFCLLMFTILSTWQTSAKQIFVEQINDVESKVQSYYHIVFIYSINRYDFQWRLWRDWFKKKKRHPMANYGILRSHCSRWNLVELIVCESLLISFWSDPCGLHGKCCSLLSVLNSSWTYSWCLDSGWFLPSWSLHFNDEQENSYK